MRTVERPLIADQEVLELLPDRVDLFAVADAVSATQTLQGRRPKAFIAAAAAAVAAVGLAIAVALVGSFGPNGGVLERALAAVGTGPVVHVVVQVHPQGTAINLSTGRRARVYAVIEQWYEPGVGLHQRVVRSNGGLEPGSLPLARGVFPQYAAALQGFGNGYRAALRRGGAHIVRRAVVAGRQVYWLRFGRTANEPGYEVAVDAKTYAPVYMRQVGVPNSGSRILSVNTVPTVPPSVLPAPSPSTKMFGIDRTGRLGPAEASTFMTRTAFWLSDSHAGLRLEWIGGLLYSEGSGRQWSQIRHHWRGIELVYGAINTAGFPDRTKQYVRIEQETEASGVPGSAPPEGTLVSYGHLGVMQKDGVFFYIEASTPDLVLSAAETLVPIR